MGEYVTITAQQAAERLLTMKLGFAFLVIVVVCFLIWLLKTNQTVERASIARSKAMAIRANDKNKLERQNWIDANCDLMGQVELLKAENEQLRKDNERMRGIMAQVKVADLK